MKTKTSKINYQVLVEDATSLRETAMDFAEGLINGKQYLKFLKGYRGPYGKEGDKLFKDGVKKARTKMRSWLSRRGY